MTIVTHNSVRYNLNPAWTAVSGDGGLTIRHTDASSKASDNTVENVRGTKKNADQALGRISIIHPYRVGFNVSSEGVYVGVNKVGEELFNGSGDLVGIFSVFASSEDLRFPHEQLGIPANVMPPGTEIKDPDRIAMYMHQSTNRFEGHPTVGSSPTAQLSYKTKVLDGLKSGRLNGKWFMPSYNILEKNIYRNRGKGEVIGTIESGSRQTRPAKYYSTWAHGIRTGAERVPATYFSCQGAGRGRIGVDFDNGSYVSGEREGRVRLVRVLPILTPA